MRPKGYVIRLIGYVLCHYSIVKKKKLRPTSHFIRPEGLTLDYVIRPIGLYLKDLHVHVQAMFGRPSSCYLKL